MTLTELKASVTSVFGSLYRVISSLSQLEDDAYRGESLQLVVRYYPTVVIVFLLGEKAWLEHETSGFADERFMIPLEFDSADLSPLERSMRVAKMELTLKLGEGWMDK